METEQKIDTQTSEGPVLTEEPLEAFLSEGKLPESEQLNIIERCIDSAEIFRTPEKGSSVFELKEEVRACFERIFKKARKNVPISWTTKDGVRALIKTARDAIASLN